MAKGNVNIGVKGRLGISTLGFYPRDSVTYENIKEALSVYFNPSTLKEIGAALDNIPDDEITITIKYTKD